MPTTYTHDAFGKATYEKMPKEWKEIIQENKQLYLIGLHGPDIFFYYRPYILKHNKVVDYGHAMHHKVARDFFEEKVKLYEQTGSKAVMAYLMGFCCHYILDSCCHPYVFAYQKKTGLAHGEIETNLDRYFMERDGKDPFSYHPASAICAGSKYAAVISEVFPEFTKNQILKTLKGMKTYCDITVMDNERKRKLFHKILGLVGADYGIGCRIIEKVPNPETKESTKELEKLYYQALEEIIPAMGNLVNAMETGEKLNQRFDRTYC